MSLMEKELFALLRLGLGNNTPEAENLSDFIMMSEEHWARLGEKALVQGVLGIVLDGVERLEVMPYKPTKLFLNNRNLSGLARLCGWSRGTGTR
jgi:hypothetical protein